jgi:uncharacterized protein
MSRQAKKSDSSPEGLWIDIEDIGEEGLALDFVKDPSFFAIEKKDFKIVKDVVIHCSLSKCDNDIYVTGKVSAGLEFACSRCLEIFTEQIDAEFSTEYLLETERPTEEEMEIVEGDFGISYYSGEKIDILPAVMDQILLSVPIKPLCKEECRGLCPQCGQNLNVGKCNCQAEDIDERLTVLKRIKL